MKHALHETQYKTMIFTPILYLMKIMKWNMKHVLKMLIIVKDVILRVFLLKTLKAFWWMHVKKHRKPKECLQFISEPTFECNAILRQHNIFSLTKYIRSWSVTPWKITCLKIYTGHWEIFSHKVSPFWAAYGKSSRVHYSSNDSVAFLCIHSVNAKEKITMR